MIVFNRFRVGSAGLALAVVLACGTAPALAADHAVSGAFAANVWSNANFLDQSSRLALTNAGSRRLKAFARDEAAEQTAAANAVVAWMESSTVDGAVASQDRGLTPAAMSPGAIVTMPLRAAADGVDGLMSGRSVAVDEPVVTRRVDPTLPTLKPNASANLERLRGLNGRAFDTLYASSQSDALLQLSTIYASYIQNGEDPGLRSLAVRELAKVDGSLAKLRRL